MKLLKNYLIVLTICVASSAFPWLHYGVVYGFPSVLLASVLITLTFRRELGEFK